MAVELKKIDTEKRNERSMHIDSMSTLDMVKLINEEDHKVAEAVAEVTPEIAKAVDVIYEQLRQGGRLVYVGAGTSGRLGILDAAECPPHLWRRPRAGGRPDRGRPRRIAQGRGGCGG